MSHSGRTPRLFTRAEAEALLPQLTVLLEEMQGVAAALEGVQTELARLQQLLRSNGHAAHAEALARQATEFEAQLRAALEQLDAWGVELKDLSRGLVDFPTRRGGRLVYLCWLLGEPGIGWWHELHTGFSGRQPIETL